MFTEELLQLQGSKIEDRTMLCSVIYLPVSGKVASGKLWMMITPFWVIHVR